MSTATKNTKEVVNESVITRHELEQLLDLAENLQVTYSRSNRQMRVSFVAVVVEIVGFLLGGIFLYKNSMGLDFSDRLLIQVIFSISLITVSFTAYFIYMFTRYRKRTRQDKANLQSVMDLVEEAQRQYAPLMSPIEKAVFGIRLRNLDFRDSRILNLTGA